MRDKQLIEREIFDAREDLEEKLSELRQFVRQRIDLGARARRALARRKQQARERPVLAAAIATLVVATVVAVVVLQWRRHRFTSR